MSGIQKLELQEQRTGRGPDLALIDATQSPDTILLDSLQTEQCVIFSDFIAVESNDKNFREDTVLHQARDGPNDIALIDATQNPDTILLDSLAVERVVIPYLAAEIPEEDYSAVLRKGATFLLLLLRMVQKRRRR